MKVSEHVPAPASAELLADGRTIRLCRGTWSEKFDLSRLDGKIEFYTGLAGPRSPSARFYGPTLDALEALRSEIGDASE